MPDITLAGHAFFPFPTGGVPTADQVSELAYFPRAVPDTLEVINGRLTLANLASATTPLPKETIRRGGSVGHMSDGGLVSASMNQDVFPFLFPNIQDVAALEDDDTFDTTAVPILGQSFYVPAGRKYVRIKWNIGILHNGSTRTTGGGTVTDYFGRMRLFVDGSAIRPVTREVRDSIAICVNDNSSVFGGNTDDDPDTRYWAGAYIIQNPSEGWHTVDIRWAAVWRANNVATHNHQARVRARRMSYTSQQ